MEGAVDGGETTKYVSLVVKGHDGDKAVCILENHEQLTEKS
ncbi:hypothetical protein [Zooshikella harenae]|nr:hypothetical protein [Zooshikella harenae]